MKKLIMGTGSYNNIKSGNGVSVNDAGGSWNYNGPGYIPLMPKLITTATYNREYKRLAALERQEDKLEEYLNLRRQIEDEYIKSYYETCLKELNIDELFEDLRNRFGDKIILLCHEEIYKFCHRRIVADYLELKTGISIPEIKVSQSGKVKKLDPIRYTERLKNIID